MRLSVCVCMASLRPTYCVCLPRRSNTGLEDNNVTIRAVKQKASDTDESVKLTKAKLEHFGAQRSLVRSSQGAARDFAVLLDLWRAQYNGRSAAPSRPAVYFRVTHLGSRWGEGENQSFVHQEAQGMRVSDFQDKLVALYETVFGADGVHFLDVQKDARTATFKAGVAYLQVAQVRKEEAGEAPPDEDSTGLVFVLELPYVREGTSDPWKRRIRYFTETALTKKRLRIVDAKVRRALVAVAAGRIATDGCRADEPDVAHRVVHHGHQCARAHHSPGDGEGVAGPLHCAGAAAGHGAAN